MVRSWQIHLITSSSSRWVGTCWNHSFLHQDAAPNFACYTLHPPKKCNHSGGSSAQTFAVLGLDLANCSDFELGQRLLILDRWDPWIAPHCLKNLPPFAVVVVKTASFGNQLSAMENTSGKQHVPMPEIFIAMLHCIVIQEVFGVFFVT
jgi:hypothetical protein